MLRLSLLMIIILIQYFKFLCVIFSGMCLCVCEMSARFRCCSLIGQDTDSNAGGNSLFNSWDNETKLNADWQWVWKKRCCWLFPPRSNIFLRIKILDTVILDKNNFKERLFSPCLMCRKRKSTGLRVIILMSPFYLSVAVSHDNVTMKQHVWHQCYK